MLVMEILGPLSISCDHTLLFKVMHASFYQNTFTTASVVAAHTVVTTSSVLS